MSRRCPIVFVPEDEQHASLMRGFFIGGRQFDYRGVTATKYWTRKTGNYVRARDWFCEEVKLQAAGHRRFGVILLVDEDGFGFSEREKYVKDKLATLSLPPLDPAKGRLLIVPMRNIESWMVWGFRWPGSIGVLGGLIDETADYKSDPAFRGEARVDPFTVGKLMAELNPVNPPSGLPKAMETILRPLNDFAAWAKLP